MYSEETSNTRIRIAAIDRLVAQQFGTDVNVIMYDINKVVVKGETKSIDVSNLETEVNAVKVLKKKESIQKELMKVADDKQISAEKLVIGYKATPKQIERYKNKYERAKQGEFEASVNATIISQHEKALADIHSYTDLIEEYRSFIDDLIVAEELDRAEEAIRKGKSLRSNTTRDDILKLMREL